MPKAKPGMYNLLLLLAGRITFIYGSVYFAAKIFGSGNRLSINKVNVKDKS